MNIRLWDLLMVIALIASTYVMIQLSGPDADRGEHITPVPAGEYKNP